MTANININIAIINIQDHRLGRLLAAVALDLDVAFATGEPADVATATAVVIADVIAAVAAEFDVVLEDPLFLLLVAEAFRTRTAWLPSR